LTLQHKLLPAALFLSEALHSEANQMATKSTTTKSAKPSAKTVAPAIVGKPVKAASKAAPANKTAAGRAAAPKQVSKPVVQAPSKPAASTTITLKHLAAELSERHDMPKKQADTILADMFNRVVDHLKAGERVRIGSLGIIEVKDCPARMGRNPATGAAIEIKASKKIAFRAAKELKGAI
jgi:DNA-binding protein HU-beta